MFPIANKIIGGREELLKSYIHQINTLKMTSFPTKSENIFRFCSYNIKYFKFENYDSNDIKSFIDKVNPDAFSLIEYDTQYDGIFKNIASSSNSVLFEQLPGYGIFSNYYNNNTSAYKLHTLNKTNVLSPGRYGHMNELRGFTHMTIMHAKTIISIITIHLDVSDETGDLRLLEITELYEFIISKSLTNVIIVGDFNEWDLQKTDNTYEDSLIDFRQRTGLEHFSTKAHDFLKQHNFTNVFHMKKKLPKFSCWSGKLVDFCYLFQDTWDESVEIIDIHMPFIPYSDHLPIIIDIKVNN